MVCCEVIKAKTILNKTFFHEVYDCCYISVFFSHKKLFTQSQIQTDMLVSMLHVLICKMFPANFMQLTFLSRVMSLLFILVVRS